MTQPFTIIPPNPWVDKNGNPTQSFFQFISNIFGSIAPTAIASKTILSNVTSGTNFPVANSLTAILDTVLGNVRGDISYRGAAVWGVLTRGSTGQAIVSNGTDAVYALIAQLGATVTLNGGSPSTLTTASGDIKIDSATHIIQVGTTVSNPSVPGNFVASKILEFKDGSGTIYYIPVDTATW